ncbi:hypothetical protein AAMO2058_000484500 [Amorphochlora amoebiformis]
MVQRMLRSTLWVALCASLSGSSSVSSSSDAWDYNYKSYPSSCDYHGKYGPYCWASQTSACGGSSQSPINIESATPSSDLHALEFTAPACQAVKMANDGTSYEIDFHDTCSNFGVHFGSHHYHLEHIEMHAPSEHTVGSARFAAELQLVHSSSEAGKLIISVLMDRSEDSVSRNNFIDYMWGTNSDWVDGETNYATVDIKHYNSIDSVSAINLDLFGIGGSSN